MKHFNQVIALLVLTAFIVSLGFAAGNPAGRLSIPQRENAKESLVKTKAREAHQVLKEEGTQFTAPPAAYEAQSVVLTKQPITENVRQLLGTTGLSGTYHIGAAQPPGFNTIANMAFLMNIGFFSGPVTFLLDDAAYTEAGVAIGPSSGTSAVNTITIRPNTGNTACVITLTDNIGNLGGFVLSGATYVTVEGTALGQPAGSRNLTIQLSATPLAANGGDAPVLFQNCQHVGITDCVVPGNAASNTVSATTKNSTNGNGSVTIRATGGQFNSFITVNNCDLSGGHFGVLSRGNFVRNASFYGVQDDDFTITNNYIHDTHRAGIDIWQVTTSNISNNIIKRVVLSAQGALPDIGYALPANGSADPATPIPGGGSRANLSLIHRPAGILVWGDFATISNNLVDSLYDLRVSAATGSAQAYGIRVVGFGQMDPGATYGGGLSMGGVPTHSVVKNNIITRIHSDNAVQANGQLWSAIGIGMDAGRFDTVVFNTVYMSGTGGTSSSAAVVINGVVETNGNSGLPDWFGDGSTVVSAFSYRVKFTDNILAVNRTGGSVNAVLGIQSSGGVMDYRKGDNNVLYMGSTGNVMERASKAVFPSVYDFQQYQIAGGQPTDASSQSDDPVLNSESDVHFSGLSTADGTGANFAGITTDYYGTVRTSPPDIGAVEGTGTGLPHDVKPVGLISPGAAGAPAGLPFAPVQVTFLNLGGFTETSFPVNVHIVNPDASVQDLPSTVTLGAGAAATVTIPGNWNPGPVGGTATFTLSTSLVGDNYTFNDVVGPISIPVAAQSTIPYTTSFETTGDRAGWFAAADWGLGTTGGKLGGPRTGSFYMATGPGPTGTATTDAHIHNLFTPFFDFTGVSSATLSFYQSIETEPSWDRGIVEYSIDTGKTWVRLGVLNDPNGINWYSTGAYNNAAGSNASPDCWDQATAQSIGFPFDGSGANPPPGWTSNGDCGGADVATGPTGYILVAKKLDGLPMMGKSYVRFRYSYFCDAGTHGNGIAIDDFTIGAAPPAVEATVSGKVYDDLLANGSFDGADSGHAGVTVTLNYFGSPVHTTLTNASGDYTFGAGNDMLYPGAYNVTANYANGKLIESPAVINYAGTGTAVTGANFGYYTGSVAGTKFNDINNDGLNNDAAGFAGFTIQVRKDSCNGAIYSSGVSGVNGAYKVFAVPGTYYVKEVPQAGYRQTFPVGNCTVVVISGVSGSPSANPTGVDFGNFKQAVITFDLKDDANGNGVYDGIIDNFPLGLGAYEYYTLKKNGITIRYDSLGNGVDVPLTYTGLDTGSYQIIQGTAPATWIHTLTNSPYSFSVTTSGMTQTFRYMDFQLFNVTGQKYEDHNGNGAQDGGDQGLAGWKFNLSGTGGGSAVTDSNGNFAFHNVGPGAHVLTEVLQAGWTNTFPVAHQYSFSGVSRFLAGDVTGQDFGNFKNISISGLKYRDRNGNGAQDAGDNGLANWQINGTNGAGSTLSDASGNWSFSNLGPGTYVITETAQLGYTKTEPVGPNYTVVASSGTDVSGLKFGNYQNSDDNKYRTWTYNELKGAGEAKPVKRPKKAPYVAPNSANMLTDLLSAPKSASISVGLSGQLIGGKEKGWVGPVKQKDVYATFNKKGIVHVGNPKPISFDNSGLKRILKQNKSLSADKMNDILLADLLTLKVNIAASDKGQTNPGLGDIIYCEPSNPIGAARMSIRAFAAKADSLMTNWDVMGQPAFTAPVYAMYDSIAAKLNAAFSTGSTGDIDSASHANWVGVAPIKLHWIPKATAQSVAYLCAPGPGVVPASIPVVDSKPVPLPTTFALYQNYPNPFNPTTTISFDLPQSAIVTLTVYNILGQEVATLLNHESLDAGNQETDFDASMFTSGVYFYRITAQGVNDDGLNTGNTFTQVKKMLLVK